jgi:putative inorganic carbon (hco3(-)) transporter
VEVRPRRLDDRHPGLLLGLDYVRRLQYSRAQVEAWLSLTTLSKVFLPVIAGVTLIDSVQRLKQLAWVLVVTQGYLALEFNQMYYAGGIDPMSWSFGGLDNNGIAISMVTSFGLAGFLGLHADRWWQKLIALASAALMAHVVLFSMSRGGMLAMCVTGAVAFWLIPKRPIHFVMLVLAALVILRLAGQDVREEFFSSFADSEVRDGSAQSRIDLTKHNLQEMMNNPLFGCGMDNWPNVAPKYGWPHGKEGHNLWAQTGAELGIPGLLALLGFYLLGCWNLLAVSRESTPVADPWLRYFARMVIAAIAGFIVSAAFVSVERIELPYYIMVLGAGTLKLYSLGVVPAPYSAPGPAPQVADDPLYAAAATS